MQDYRAARGTRQLQLLDKHALLHIPGRMIVMVIEADLPPPQKAGMTGQTGEHVVVRRCGELRLVRMEAGGGIDPLVAFGKGHAEARDAGSAPPPPMARMVCTPAARARASIASRSDIEFDDVDVGVRIHQLERRRFRFCGSRRVLR